jgi:2-polyprenyl-3-methyl-5-hydroxy-6-metoxy-1,4-benzoquinol methylase
MREALLCGKLRARPKSRTTERRIEMAVDYRSKLFSSYNATHVSHLDADDESKLAFFREYTCVNYLQHLGKLDGNSAEILEIACNKGYLLAALHSLEFKNLFGVDLSPLDVEKAKQIVPSAEISYADAFDYLGEKVEKFDVIILKAVLEHIQKDQVIPLLNGIKSSLKPSGMVIIDVPNMDWLFAQHERYMDFTHEVGFTRESLAQVMRQVFSDVRIEKGKPVMGSGLKARIELQLRAMLVRSMNLAFRIIGEGASDTWWDSRSIIGVGKND